MATHKQKAAKPLEDPTHCKKPKQQTTMASPSASGAPASNKSTSPTAGAIASAVGNAKKPAVAATKENKNPEHPPHIRKALVITTWSHKGGVGKTTICRQLAYSLAAEQKLRVLCIDADTQANLTALMMMRQEAKPPAVVKSRMKETLNVVHQLIHGESLLSGAAAAAAGATGKETQLNTLAAAVQDAIVSDIVSKIATLPLNNSCGVPLPIDHYVEEPNSLYRMMYNGLAGGFYTLGDWMKMHPPSLIWSPSEPAKDGTAAAAAPKEGSGAPAAPANSAAQTQQEKQNSDSDKDADKENSVTHMNDAKARGPGVWLVPGSRKMPVIHHECRSDRLSYSDGPHAIGLFGHVVNTLIETGDYDVVLIDLNPSNEWFNQLVVAYCDYVLPCIQADQASLTSITSMIESILPRWALEHNVIRGATTRQQNTRRPTFVPPPVPAKIICFLANHLSCDLDFDSCHVLSTPSAYIEAMQNILREAPIQNPSLAYIHTVQIVPFLPRVQSFVVMGDPLAVNPLTTIEGKLAGKNLASLASAMRSLLLLHRQNLSGAAASSTAGTATATAATGSTSGASASGSK